MERSHSEIKLFQILQKPFAILGISDPQKSQRHQFNARNFVCLLFLGLYTILTGLFFLVEAETFEEYADSFYASFSMATIFFTCSSTMSDVVEIYELTSGFEALIQKREPNSSVNDDEIIDLFRKLVFYLHSR